MASALHNLERYCIVLVHTLKHLKPAMCVINITYSFMSIQCDTTRYRYIHVYLVLLENFRIFKL